MRNLNRDDITEAALKRFADTPDPRLRQIMLSLVQHLHRFAKDVDLTHAEWVKGIEFLTRVGQISDDKRQEFILLSDTLGLSMLTVAINNTAPPGCTESTVLGPFHVKNAPHYALGADVSNGAKGAPCRVSGSVRGLGGEAVPGATIEVWQSDDAGLYDVQYEALDEPRGRGVLTADANGKFHFVSILPVPYPIPADGPVGEMLRATDNHPWRPAHLHFMITAPGYEELVTHVFNRGDPYLDSDAVFGVRESLVADWLRQPDGTFLLEYHFVLNPLSDHP